MNRPKVYIVGAGPGDPELISLKGKRLLEEADVVIYDRLVGSGVLEFANPSAELIFAGKETGCQTMAQEEINLLMADFARKGKAVVRLKGGDPYTFGRGSEEANYLFNESIPFEVVPGITAAAGAAAYAGIPLTDRRYSPAVTFITGHRMKGAELKSLNWASLSKLNHTLVFYMGLANISVIAENLIKNGMARSTPAAIVSRATTPFQETVAGTIGDIDLRAGDRGTPPPALLIIGEVVNLRDLLGWFESEIDRISTGESLGAVDFDREEPPGGACE